MSTTTISSAVVGARGLLWISEAARDIGVDVESMDWRARSARGVQWAAQLDGRDDLERLGDRLGLDATVVEGCLASRSGTWADMSVEIYTGADR